MKGFRLWKKMGGGREGTGTGFLKFSTVLFEWNEEKKKQGRMKTKEEARVQVALEKPFSVLTFDWQVNKYGR